MTMNVTVFIMHAIKQVTFETLDSVYINMSAVTVLSIIISVKMLIITWNLYNFIKYWLQNSHGNIKYRVENISIIL